MDDTKIRNLLRQADRIAGPPPMDPLGLADRVRRLRARRQRIRIAASAAVAALIAVSVGAAFFATRLPIQPLPVNQPPTLAELGAPSPDTRPDLDRLQAHIDQLRAEADSALALVREVSAVLEQQRRLAELDRASASIDPRDEVRWQINQAAFISVYQADRMYRELDLRESAVESYRQVISLFPDTPAAEVARQRLSEIGTSKGDKL
jgi:hypothetical protein